MVCTTETVSYETCYNNRKITVTLEYPKQSDKKAQQEFYGRLKERILQNIGQGTVQGGQQSRMPQEIHNRMAKGET